MFETEGEFYCLIETGGSNAEHDEEVGSFFFLCFLCLFLPALRGGAGVLVRYTWRTVALPHKRLATGHGRRAAVIAIVVTKTID